jgi:hypothetical protein
MRRGSVPTDKVSSPVCKEDSFSPRYLGELTGDTSAPSAIPSFVGACTCARDREASCLSISSLNHVHMTARDDCGESDSAGSAGFAVIAGSVAVCSTRCSMLGLAAIPFCEIRLKSARNICKKN